MAENTSIEWTAYPNEKGEMVSGFTFNPWRGCTQVSPACLHCYAETLSKRNPAVLGQWGKGAPRVLGKAAYMKKPLAWNQRAAKDGTRPRVFCASLADWLDDEVPIEWLADLLDLIRRTPNLDWLLLTKRPQNWRERLNDVAIGLHQIGKSISAWETGFEVRQFARRWIEDETYPENVWIGTTVEDQTRADERIPLLLSIPAKVRFLSCEPLLGPVQLDWWLKVCKHWKSADGLTAAPWHPPYPKHWYEPQALVAAGWECPIQWVIVGGESGPGARPMHPDWARSLRDQCSASGVPFLFKQWGEWKPDVAIADQPRSAATHSFPTGKFIQTYGGPVPFAIEVTRVGKKAAGRLIDGREHNEFPNP